MIVDRDLAVPLSDGTRLSAKIWMPETANSEPVPAILEYLPYRKSDGTAERDHPMHRHFAENGYACLRVDRRGCGDSEGLFDDEYSEEELCDGEEIIAWIAAQPWCTGSVGIQGISWGGFNGLQLAARAPEALKAVISIGTTVDRYHHDIHYKGGIQLSENVGWAATVLSWFSMPSDPKLRSDWREDWLNRLSETPFLAKRWTEHADRDPYWKHGSVCEDYAAIKAPVLVMGGLHDGYRNAMAALAENLQGPVKAIVGPWSHKYPHITTIGPSIDYFAEALRWWDHWLKGIDTGVTEDADYRAFVMDSAVPDAAVKSRAGRWFGVDKWPAADAQSLEFGLGDGKLGEATSFDLTVAPDARVGRQAGEFFPFGFGPGEMPGDQTADDARSVCFESNALDQELVLMGAGVVNLHVAATQPRAQLVVRLCDVRPDGTSMLIALGMLNLRHRNGFEIKEDLEPGETYDVSIELDQCAYRIPAGHRLRLAVSQSYWPFCWPEGDSGDITLTAGALSVPLMPGTAQETWFQEAPPFEPREMRALGKGDESKDWQETPDGTLVLTIKGDRAGRVEDVETGIVTQSAVEEIWSIHPDHPEAAKAEITWRRSFGRENWGVDSVAHITMRGTADEFVIEQSLTASENGAEVFSKNWQAKIPR